MRRGAAVLLIAAACGDAASSADASSPALDGEASPLDAAPPPTPPAGLQRWLVGDAADRAAAPRAGILLLGGGPDVDAAFAWQRDRIDGGDVVVLRASGADGYNDYLFETIGGVDSVETLIVDTAALAADPYVSWTLDRAEAVFLAGGDQAVYVDAWRETPLAAALDRAARRGAVLGGTSAGCAVLGGIVFAATNGSVYSDEALADPYNRYMTLERELVELSPLTRIVTDTHFGARDRMGRLVAFAARAIQDGWTARPIGIGVDEGTALVVDERGEATVLGAGSVYVVVADHPPTTCAPDTPLVWRDLSLHELVANDTITLPDATTDVPARTLAAEGGVLDPADPY
jgi:cyanophycinase